jgi:hypothetical protein
MFKTISAALVAVSVLAAPAFAATTKSAEAPVIKSSQINKATATKANVKPNVLNANARMSRHHVKHVRHHAKHTRHYAKFGHKTHKKFVSIKSHKRIGAIKTHGHNKVSFKHTHTATKRG